MPLLCQHGISLTAVMRCDPLSGTSFEPCETHSDIKVESAISTCEKFTGLFYPEYLYRHLAHNNTTTRENDMESVYLAGLLSWVLTRLTCLLSGRACSPTPNDRLTCLPACPTGSCLLPNRADWQTDRQTGRQRVGRMNSRLKDSENI